MSMFNWFKRNKFTEQTTATDDMMTGNKKMASYPTSSEPIGEVEPVTVYSVGPTDNNRVSLKMSYSSITMSKEGVQSLIDLLQVAMNHLDDEYEDEE